MNADPADCPRRRPTLKLDNGTGSFTDDGREYVIELPAGKVTPRPWCNVIANAEVGCLVSESSLGTTRSLNSGENRLTPWRSGSVFDTPSEALYLRDEESAEICATTALPSGHGGNTLIRHGAGYTTYERESHGLVQELTVFVPPDSAIEIVRLRVKNTLGRHRRLTATYYAEWVLGARREKATAAHRLRVQSRARVSDGGSRGPTTRSRQRRVASGIVSMSLDGRVLAAGIIPLDLTTSNEHEVLICLGHAVLALSRTETAR